MERPVPGETLDEAIERIHRNRSELQALAATLASELGREPLPQELAVAYQARLDQ